jgi:hypothetical protein
MKLQNLTQNNYSYKPAFKAFFAYLNGDETMGLGRTRKHAL